ncbi:ABC transporter permease [Aeromicrobium sp. CTD01-1L150]|uniref:ABC transporter permease n=1 Tax=Aeromicrobium sp. CTD01-1L150 TaxID=3341830 RepID=UPI0035C0B908
MSAETTAAWRLVAENEIRTRLRQKSFLITTGISVLLIVGGILAASFFTDRPQERTVAVVDDAAAAVVQTAAEIGRADNDRLSIEVRELADVAAVERALGDGDVDAALLSADGGYEVVGDENVPTELSGPLQTAARTTVLQDNARVQGVDLEDLERGSETPQRLLSSTEGDGVGQASAFAFIILFFVVAIGSGMMIAGSVAQEKESRVVEILAATVPVRQLLWGKILGNTVLAVGQVVLFVAAGATGLLVSGLDVPMGRLGPALGWYVVFFVLGFTALASLWAVAGALASRQQDLQSTTAPAQALLFIPYFAFFFGNDLVQQVVSMLPIVSSMVMPARMATEAVPLWQTGLAVGGTVVVTILLIRLGARIYERTLLRTGDKISYRDALTMSDD